MTEPQSPTTGRQSSSSVPGPRSVLVLGLGNPLLGDDGVGWRVAEAVREEIARPDCSIPDSQLIEIDCHAGGGLSLMERLAGYGHAILVDAIDVRRGPPGSVYCFPLHELPDPGLGHLGSSHDTSLQTALELGASLGLTLPERIMVVAVESPNVYDFSEQLSPPVAAAVPRAVWEVIRWLEGLTRGAD